MKKTSPLSYSLLAFCLAFIGLPIYIYLPNYYQDNFGMSLQTIGIIILLTRFVDALQDPLFGLVSDRVSTYRRQIVLLCSPMLGLCFLALFSPISTNGLEWWLAIMLVLTYSFFSLIYINYQAQAVGMSQDYHAKTSIIAYREFFFILGIIAATLIPAVLEKFLSQVEAFLYIGIGYILLISLFALIFYNSSAKQVLLEPKTTATASLGQLLQDKDLRSYSLIFTLNAFSSAIPAVLILFFIEQYLGLKDISWLLMLLYFVGLLAGVAFWTRVSCILKNKLKTWLISSTLVIGIFSLCLFLEAGDALGYGIICVFSGLAFGGDLCLGYSYLTDLIQEKQQQTHQAKIFGATNFILKISLALSSGILVYLVGYFEQSPDTQAQFIYLNYVLPAIILRLISTYYLFKLCQKQPPPSLP